MKSFVTGLLVKNEPYTADSGNSVHERWLTLEVASGVQLPIFVHESGLVNADLQVGQVYEMVIKVNVFGKCCYHAFPPCLVDAILDGVNLTGAMYMEEQLAQARSYENVQR